MTQEQETRLKEMGARVESVRRLVTDNPYMVDYSVVDRQFLYDLLLQTIAERDEARKLCVGYRERAIFAMYGNQAYREDFPYRARERLPWEAKDV